MSAVPISFPGHASKRYRIVGIGFSMSAIEEMFNHMYDQGYEYHSSLREGQVGVFVQSGCRNTSVETPQADTVTQAPVPAPAAQNTPVYVKPNFKGGKR